MQNRHVTIQIVKHYNYSLLPKLQLWPWEKNTRNLVKNWPSWVLLHLYCVFEDDDDDGDEEDEEEHQPVSHSFFHLRYVCLISLVEQKAQVIGMGFYRRFCKQRRKTAGRAQKDWRVGQGGGMTFT